MSELNLNLLGIYASIFNGLIMLINFALEPHKFYGKLSAVFIFTKPLIVPLIYWHLSLNMTEVPREILLWCVFCFLGDMILLFRSVAANKLGCISFLISQIIITRHYKATYDFQKMLNPLFLLIVIPPAILFFFILYPKALGVKPIYADGIVYLVSLIVALATSLLKLLQSNNYLASSAGHFFFIISDYFLINATIMDTTDHYNIIVLPTYIIALLGISTGVILEQKNI